MNTNFSLKPGSTSTTKMLLSLLREKDWTIQELCDELGCASKSIYGNLTYYRKIGLVERIGAKPCYVYKLKK